MSGDPVFNSAGDTPVPASLLDEELELVFTELALHSIHKLPAYYFQMRHAQSGVEMGSINLRAGSTPHIERYAGHIGYGVHPQFRGRHYAARSVRLLTPFAETLGIDPLWITCDPENIASRRSLEIAGAEFIEIVDVPPDCIIHRNGHPRKCRFRLAINATQK